MAAIAVHYAVECKNLWIDGIWVRCIIELMSSVCSVSGSLMWLQPIRDPAASLVGRFGFQLWLLDSSWKWCPDRGRTWAHNLLWETYWDDWLIESKSKMTCSLYSSCQPYPATTWWCTLQSLGPIQDRRFNWRMFSRKAIFITPCIHHVCSPGYSSIIYQGLLSHGSPLWHHPTTQCFDYSTFTLLPLILPHDSSSWSTWALSSTVSDFWITGWFVPSMNPPGSYSCCLSLLLHMVCSLQ